MQTRKQLHAKVQNLCAQLEACGHVTRKGLNAHVQRVEQECTAAMVAKNGAEEKLKAVEAERDRLKMDLENIRDQRDTMRAELQRTVAA
jgi:predicted  nucleic acid-binding Zn-ribbon protein